jgi:two-component system, OmpR family, response regulator PhoP
MINKAKVLVVEDNDDMRNAVCNYLSDNGYVVSSAASAESAMEKSFQISADVAVLDISLPGITGLDFTQKLKDQGFDGPIIAITARDTVEDKIIGFGAGMDDYLVKPFDLRELVARINAQLRTKGEHHDLAAVRTSTYSIEPKRHRFYVNDQLVKLTLVEFRLMLKLMQHNRAAVSSQDLIETAWGDDALTSNPPIRIHISNLRNKIGDSNLTKIQTIPGVGYILND